MQCVRRRRTIVLVRVLVGDDGEDLAGWRAESGAALGGVERGQGSRTAGARIDEAAASAHALDDRVDRGGERVSRLGDCGRNRGVFLVEETDEIARRAEVEVGEVRARSLGRRGLGPTREGGTHRIPDERRVRCRERRHVATGLVPPRPEVVDSFFARCRDRSFEVGDVLAREAEAGHPELRRYAVAVRGLAQEPCEPAHERLGRTVPVLPVRIGDERGQAGQRGDLVPVGESLRALGRGEQADRVRAVALGDVGEHLAQEADDRRLAKGLHLGRELARDRPAEALGAPIAAARPARRVVDSDVHRDDPRGLVPEDRVDAALEHPVGPLLAEVAVGGAVETGGRDSPPVVQHLALLGMERDPAALRLAAEGAPEPPRAREHGQPGGVRDLDDLGHRVAVVGEVVLGERVQDARVPARRKVGHVRAHVARNPDAEVGAARASHRSGHDHLILARRPR